MKPTLIIIAGPNGSGKTTITSKILRHEWVEDCIYINPDEIAMKKFGDWNSTDAIKRSAEYCTELRYQLLSENKNIIFETVFSSQEKLEFIFKAIEKKYFIRLFFVATEGPEINTRRITARVMKGGHDVPISKIISRYFKSISYCNSAASIVDRLYVYDNTEDEAEAKLLFRANNGKLKKVYENINEWAKPILNGLQK